MFFTATQTSPYQRATRCQRLGYHQPSSSPYAASRTLGVEDLLESLTRVAYQEELARREKIAAELKRKRLEEQHRQELQRQTLVRHFEQDDFFQIEILKQIPSKKNFKSFQIQYFKKGDELSLVVESEPDQFSKQYRFQACEIDERRIDYKIIGERLLVIQVPKRTRSEIDEERVFNFLQHQQDRLNEARIRQRCKEQQLREQQLKEHQLRQQQLRERKYLQLKKLAEAERAERVEREKRQREEQLKLQRERQEALQQYFNSFVTLNENQLSKELPSLTINGIQFAPDSHHDSENEIASDFEDTPSTPEVSDSSDEEDPDVSDISELIEQNTIKSVSSASSETESDSEHEESVDEEVSNKKRKLRSPLLEEVEDEEFSGWSN